MIISEHVDNKVVRLHDLFTEELLNEHLKNGVIRQQMHPSLFLSIFNYTEKAQIEGIWDSCTTKCRGLIADSEGFVVARAFDKFHNLNTHHIEETWEPNLPSTPPSITKKMDGSLGILWYYMGRAGIATRGSFASDQSKWATAWYEKHVAQEFEKGWVMDWPEGWTPVFEIIYAANRIVVDYDFEGLVLLAIVNNLTGEEMAREELEDYGWRNNLTVVEESTKTIEECKAENTPNEEGYVLSWPREGRAPLKVKVKFEEYCRLHRVVTNMNPKSVWELVSSGQKGMVESLLADEKMPKPFREWLMSWYQQLLLDYQKIEQEAAFIFSTAYTAIGYPAPERRKQYALFFQAQAPKLTAVLFAMLDGKPWETAIWKMIKPKFSDTFRVEGA
jgi:RNA ligase